MSDQLRSVLTPVLARYDLELDAVEVIPAGKRRVLRIVVDGDGPSGTGPLLDDIASASKACSMALDEAEAMGAAAYTLEVTSRGVSRPLERPQHWRRNVGRLVAVTAAGQKLTGRITEAGADAVVLEVDGEPQPWAYAELKNALIQVEMNRRTPAGAHEGLDEDDRPVDHEDEEN